MRIRLHPSFNKSYKKRIANNPKLIRKVADRIALSHKDPAHPLLEDHHLVGKKLHLSAFSITGDILIVYLPISENETLFS